MKKENQIPNNIWETDCKYCKFRNSKENFAYGNGKTRYDKPCKIGGYDGKSRIWNEKTKKFDLTEHEAHKEHCSGCKPNEGFGICHTCQYFNSFHKNDSAPYCTHIDRPLNRRNTMPHIKVGYSKQVDSWHFTYFTCDRYRVDESDKKQLLDKALTAKIPMNFNPETWKSLEYIEGEPIKEWEEQQLAHEYNKPENIRRRELREKIRQKIKKVGN